MGRRSEQCGRLMWCSVVFLLQSVPQVTLSQITYSGGGRLDCGTAGCQGQSVLITGGQTFSVSCRGTNECRGSDFTVQSGCTLSGDIDCDRQDACRDATLTVYSSDLSAHRLDCLYESGSSERLCQNMMVTLRGNTKMPLLCGYNSRNDCSGMVIRVYDTSRLTIDPETIDTPITVYLYDQGTVVDNGFVFTIITQSPTLNPTRPTGSPTKQTTMPTSITVTPTKNPTRFPTQSPTMETSMPTQSTPAPTSATSEPTMIPSQSPTIPPVVFTEAPSEFPTFQPTMGPTIDPGIGEDAKKGGASNMDLVLLIIVLVSVIIVLFLLLCGVMNYHCYQNRQKKKKEAKDGRKAEEIGSQSRVYSLDDRFGPMPDLMIVRSAEGSNVDTTSVFIDDAPRFHSSVQIEGESGAEEPRVEENMQMYGKGRRTPTKKATQSGVSSVDAIRNEDEHELMYMNVRSKGGPTRGTRKPPPPPPAKISAV